MHKSYTTFLIVFTLLILSGCSQPTTESGQYYYNSPQQAADALVHALSKYDPAMLENVLSPDYHLLIPLSPADDTGENIQPFLLEWEKHHTLIAENETTTVIQTGNKDWTLPIPIIKEDKGWRFDLEAGLERIQKRRIGRNELSAMRASLAYYDAQLEYKQHDYDNDGVQEYAQKFISSPGKQDGLYWPTEKNLKPSPLGPLFADVTAEGAYHGYYYKIISSQGEYARGGAHSYLDNNNMVSGFALISWPAEYGRSGVMSFILNDEGILFETNLGPNGEQFAQTLSTFNPEPLWATVAEEFLSSESR